MSPTPITTEERRRALARQAAEYGYPLGHLAAPPLPSVALRWSDAVRDGEVLVGHGVILLGTRPWTPEEVAREDARRIVRHGLADVLAWLGEEPGPAPGQPVPLRSGTQAMRDLRYEFGLTTRLAVHGPDAGQLRASRTDLLPYAEPRVAERDADGLPVSFTIRETVLHPEYVAVAGFPRRAWRVWVDRTLPTWRDDAVEAVTALLADDPAAARRIEERP